MPIPVTEELNAAAPTTQRRPATGPIAAAWLRQFSTRGEWVRFVTHIGSDIFGLPIYRISIQRGNSTFVQTWAMTGATQTLIKPTMSIPGNQQPGQGAASEAVELQRAKDRWLTWLVDPVNQISANERGNFARLINSWTGSAQELQDSMLLSSHNLPFGATGELQGGEFGDSLGIGGLSFGGGGGGGGSFGPEYVKPDERVVQDFVTGTMVSLTGTVLDDEFDRIVAIYMTDHRRNFDSLDETIDPSQSVVEAVRSTEEYGRIHALRPDSADERTWISDRRKAAARGGLTEGKQEDFAIIQATVGGDIDDVEVAGSVAQLQTSGRATGIIERRMRSVAEGIFGAVRR